MPETWHGFDPADLQVDIYRMGPANNPHVAVRVTHKPSGASATVKSDDYSTGSAHKLRNYAVERLREKVDA